MRSCVLEQPTLTPLFAAPAAAPAATDESQDDDDEDDDDEEDDDDDDDDEEFDEEAVRGMLLPDGVTCLGFGGNTLVGVQGDWMASSGRKLMAWRNQDVLSLPYAATFRFDTLQPTDSGWTLGAGLTMAYRSGSDSTVDRAVLKAGGFAAGLDSSRFNFWDGAGFASVARVPARQSYQFAHDLALTETSRIGLSAEVPVPVPSLLPFPDSSPGLHIPDVIARYLYEGDSASLQMAVALHEIRQTYSGPPRIGRAAMIGMSRLFTLAGVTHTVSAQLAATLGAPVYIGSQIDGLTSRALLSGTEFPSGYSAVISLNSAWSETWSTNAFFSRYDLQLPARNSSGRIEMSRGAANVVWSPTRTTRIGFEAGVTRTVVDLPSRILSFDPSGRRTTLQMFIERKF